MANPNFDSVVAAIQQAWAVAEAELAKYNANLPPEAQPAIAAITAIAENAIQSNINSIREELVGQFVNQFLAGHGPVAKSGVDLA